MEEYIVKFNFSRENTELKIKATTSEGAILTGCKVMAKKYGRTKESMTRYFMNDKNNCEVIKNKF